MKSKIFQLKNGLQVLCIESKKSPVISAQVWVRTGSADEGKGEEGLSHFIEHLVFKGTEKYEVGEIASTVEGSGGELNAYTSFDQTVFYVTISKEYSNVAMDVLSQMMGFPEFDADEIDNEREVVIEEIKRGLDNPHRQVSQLLFSTVYKNHPYGKPVIGYAENIKKVSRKKILDYFHRRYSTKNMFLVVTGDFETKEMKKQVENTFGKIKATKFGKSKRKAEPPQQRAKIKVLDGPFEEEILHIAFRGPKATSKDAVALDVLSMILGAGESSRLMSALRINNHLANYSVSSTFLPQDKGFLAVSTSLLEDKREAALKEIKDQLIAIIEEPPAADELEKIVSNLESDEYYGLQTVDGLARKFGTYQELFKDYKYYKEYLKQVRGLKPEDISKVAKKYLNPEQLTAVLITNKDKNAVEPLIRNFLKEYKKDYKQYSKAKIKSVKVPKRKSIKWTSKPSKEVFKKVELNSGAHFVGLINSDTPVVSFKTAFLGGSRFEDDKNEGITEALSRALISNTKNLSEPELIKKQDELSSAISAFGGRNTMGITLTTLSPYLDEIMGLYDEVFKHPVIKENVVKREVVQILEQLRNRKDNPAQICMRNFTKKLFQNHPYSRDPLGNEENLNAFTSEQLQSHWESSVSGKQMTIVGVGDFDFDKWCNHFDRLTSELPTKNVKIESIDLDPQGENLKVFEEYDKEQNHIVLGFKGLSLSEKGRYDLQVIQSILSGQGGRLFLELRDKKSLAYSVSPIRLEGLDAGYFGVYIGCSPDKSKEAIEGIEEQLKRICEEKVSEQEIERAKKFCIGRHDIELQRNTSIASSILFDDIYGIPFDETYHFSERINEVSSASIQELSQRIFEQPKVISVVGTNRPW